MDVDDETAAVLLAAAMEDTEGGGAGASTSPGEGGGGKEAEEEEDPVKAAEKAELKAAERELVRHVESDPMAAYDIDVTEVSPGAGGREGEGGRMGAGLWGVGAGLWGVWTHEAVASPAALARVIHTPRSPDACCLIPLYLCLQEGNIIAEFLTLLSTGGEGPAS